MVKVSLDLWQTSAPTREIQTGATATSSCVKDHESLKTSAVVSQLADAIQHINVYPSSRSSTDKEIHVSAETAPDRPCRS